MSSFQLIFSSLLISLSSVEYFCALAFCCPSQGRVLQIVDGDLLHPIFEEWRLFPCMVRDGWGVGPPTSNLNGGFIPGSPIIGGTIYPKSASCGTWSKQLKISTYLVLKWTNKLRRILDHKTSLKSLIHAFLCGSRWYLQVLSILFFNCNLTCD